MKIRTLIIEDIPDNRAALKNLLASNCPQVEIVGEADSQESGYAMILQEKPNLVFMDIQLREGTGFDILARLLEQDAINFEVIFFTAHGNYENVIMALEYSALDFITKPIQSEKLIQSVHKVERRLNKVQYKKQIDTLLKNIRKGHLRDQPISIHLSKGLLEFVDVADILYLEADTSITYVHLENGHKWTAMKNLGTYSKLLLADYHFFAISHSIVINLDYLKTYDPKKLLVTFKNGKTVSASRRGGRDFKYFLANNKRQYGDLQPSFLASLLQRLLGSEKKE